MVSQKIKLSLFLILIITLVSCSYLPIKSTKNPFLSPTINEVAYQPSATNTRTPTASSTYTQTPSSIPPSHTPTASPSDTPTAIPSDTPTLTPMPSPTPLPTLPPPEPIIDREPSVEQLDTYLIELPKSYFDIAGCGGKTNDINYHFQGLTGDSQILYKDVNGDDLEDMIVSDHLLLAIFIWNGEAYATPFVVASYGAYYVPDSQTGFADWTADDLPEIEYNLRDNTRGVGVQNYVWCKFIVHCKDADCGVIWSGHPAYLVDQVKFGGMFLYKDNANVADTAGQLQLIQYSEGFSIYDNTYFNPNLEPEISRVLLESLTVFTSTQTIFEWTGSTYDQIDKKDTSGIYRTEEDSSLSSKNKLGDVASIEYEKVYASIYENDACQLLIDGNPVGDQFGCKYNFTSVEWQDLVGDSQDEVLVIALSGGIAVDSEGHSLPGGKRCVHQRLFIYQWNGEKAEKIADQAGCVVQADLYGVRLEDLDGDRQKEIIAADHWFDDSACNGFTGQGCWYDFGFMDQVYKWDGEQFVYWGDLGSIDLD